MTIKIGKETIEPQKGDYICYDGKIYNFETGDKRRLQEHGGLPYVRIPKTLLKSIPLNTLKEEKITTSFGTKLTLWYF